jgi:ketosteroid isomerase-like protein
MRWSLSTPWTFLVLATACSSSGIDPAAERAALMQASRDWAASVAGGNVDSMLSYWSDDAIVLPPDQPAVVGKEAIRGFVSGMLAIPGFSITWEPEQASISADGDVGYLIERNTATYTDSTGTRVTQHGKAVTVWRKNAEGQWKCVVDTWNNVPSHPVLPPSPPS